MKALILDDDATVLGATERAVSSCAITSCEVVTDSAQAWDRIAHETYDLLVLDWRLPGLSGIALLNRIRASKRNAYTPVLVISGYLTTADFRLIEEFPLTSFLEKPFALPLFQFKVKDLLNSAAWLNDRKEQLSGAFTALDENGENAAGAVLEALKGAPRPLPLILAASRMLIEKRHDAEAEALLVEHLAKDPDALGALTLLGKVYLRQHRFADALRVLSRAQAASPQNLERLCLIGNAHLRTLDTQSAVAAFDAAVDIDPGHTKARAGRKIAVSIENYLALPSTASVPGNFASLLNVVGISYVRSERFEAGIQFYRNAMEYVDDPQTQAKLAYNIGLGFVRAQLPEQGVPWFRKSDELAGGTFSKPLDMLRQLTGETRSVRPPAEGLETSPPAFAAEPARAPTEHEEMAASSDAHNEPAMPTFDAGSLDAIDSSQLAATPIDDDDDDTPLDLSDLHDYHDYEQISADLRPAAPTPSQAADDFLELRKLIANLRLADDTLFSQTGRTSMRRHFDAYSALHGSTKLCIFLPNTLRPTDIARLDANEARSRGVLILQRSARDWTPLWPLTDGATDLESQAS